MFSTLMAATIAFHAETGLMWNSMDCIPNAIVTALDIIAWEALAW